MYYGLNVVTGSVSELYGQISISTPCGPKDVRRKSLLKIIAFPSLNTIPEYLVQLRTVGL
jgi:hypothetical protein